MTDEYDPVDPAAASSGNLLHQYQQEPPGLGFLAVVQLAVGILLGWQAWILLGRAGVAPAAWVVGLMPGLLFAASAAGLFLRRGWGWWLTCTLYAFIFFDMPVSLALWTLDKGPFSPLLHLGLFTAAMLAVAYLHRAAVLRFIRFSTADGRPSRVVRQTPVWAALSAAVVRLLVELLRR